MTLCRAANALVNYYYPGYVEKGLTALKARLLGTSDPVIPIERTRPQIPPLKAAGVNVEWREFAKVHTIQGEIEMTVIREFVRAGYAVVGK